ncbi:AraC family transcriptional regulator [Leptolyngbya sp. FACHB-261]|uniref:helix-turn-helix domain-containing protein n=1 Tax=Leptolyngbya sp. FACHB-261 TaxID=2692806 RepID=UPI0016886BF4|nr:AraC family transcriptional regulator [Leptolyngbya sp. FACHB-261]MBD2102526.1 helix-turn-helix transcriptional regulator [Leptolyngbya sp. FACHB-261]
MSSKSALHPADVIQPEWVLSSQSLHSSGLTIEHQVQPSGECEISGGLTHHVLVFELGNVSRQVIRMDGQEHDSSLRQGDILLIPAGVPFFSACEAMDEVLAFIINPFFLEQLSLAADCPQAERVELASTFKHRDRQIEWIVRSLQREMQTAALGSRLYLDSLTNLLAIHLLRHYTLQPLKQSKPEPGLGGLKLNRVIDYINAHLEQEIQLADLAQVTNFNPCYFASLFKQSMRISPWQYIMQQRVERAKKLLEQHNHSILEVALQCGFNSQSHFTYQFRRLTGMTPNAYRNR